MSATGWGGGRVRRLATGAANMTRPAQRGTAAYIAGPQEDGGRDAGYFLLVKGNQPGVQRAVFDLIQGTGTKAPDHVAFLS